MNHGSNMQSWLTWTAWRFRLLSVFLLCICLSTMVSAADTTEAQLPGLDAVLSELKQGGLVIYLRHGITDQTDADDAKADMARCETQRNLAEEGRQQAIQIGAAMRQLKIPVGTVLSSPFCRCRDMAQLAFGRYTVNNDLYFALNVTQEERQRLTDVLRTLLATPPEPGHNTVIVAHTANLKEAAKLWPKPEGVAYVFRPEAGKGFVPLARIPAEQWSLVATAQR